LNILNVSDVRQIDIQTAEPLVPGPNCVEVEIATAELKKYKWPDNDRIQEEMNQAQGKTLLC
jgi:hypothetical protein